MAWFMPMPRMARGYGHSRANGIVTSGWIGAATKAAASSPRLNESSTTTPAGAWVEGGYMADMIQWACEGWVWAWLGAVAVALAFIVVMVWVHIGVSHRAVTKRGVDR